MVNSVATQILIGQRVYIGKQTEEIGERQVATFASTQLKCKLVSFKGMLKNFKSPVEMKGREQNVFKIQQYIGLFNCITSRQMQSSETAAFNIVFGALMIRPPPSWTLLHSDPHHPTM